MPHSALRPAGASRAARAASALDLHAPTPVSWVRTVLDDFDAFLLDHGACERKAAATGMLFVVRYPDRAELVEPLIAFAREELGHFHEVYRLIARRGLRLGADVPDPYAAALLERVRHGRDERFLDRLLVAGILEARGGERFALLAEHLPDEESRSLYRRLARADGRHRRLFFDLARTWFDEAEIRERGDRLLAFEAELVARLPRRPALYG